MKDFKPPFYIRLAFMLLIFVTAGYIAVVGKNLIVPLLFAFLFAILLLPVANFCERRLRMSRGLSSILAVLLLLLFVSLVIYILGAQIAKLGTEWTSLKSLLDKMLHTIQNWVANKFHIDIEKQTAYVQNAADDITKSSGDIFKKTILSVSTTLLFTIFFFFDTAFLLYYRRLLMRFLLASFNEKHNSIIHAIFDHIKYIIKRYMIGLFFETVIISLISGIVFWILGLKYVFLMALIVGVFNLVPYLGIFTALAICAAVTYSTIDGRHALFVVITIMLLHPLDSNFIMPKIVGSQVKLNLLIVIIGVIIGEMLFGIAGMVLSVPYLAIAKIIFDRIPELQPWGILLGEENDTPGGTKKSGANNK